MTMRNEQLQSTMQAAVQFLRIENDDDADDDVRSNDENINSNNDTNNNKNNNNKEANSIVEDPATKGSEAMRRSLRTIQNSLECHLCENVLTEPVTIPCGHTFCCNCIDRHIDNSWYCPSTLNNMQQVYKYSH
jgi:zinc finger of C3HC4-type, RING